ncbi:TetR/AcrR family transcriptional regulator [Euzebya tangerina]|uniref:TetR/AcrR family transcriptional regulator n=1 Tax=Euzebya tangerina TaxID=591198 RepID=UPI000E323719|nr:TetR/AcrR family transcriptional regulator [Euzebya tangerina]
MTVSDEGGGRSQRSERERQIIEVATSLFRRKGYHVTSLEDLAEAIGFTKPAIYYYFNSKEDILFTIVDGIVEQALERTTAIAEGDGTAGERLHQLLVANTGVLLENLDANTVFYNERGLLTPQREAAIRAREREYTGVVRALYVQGVEDGEFIDMDPAVATATLLGASIWSYRWFDPDGSLSIDEIAVQIADLLLGGLRR